VRAAPKRLFTIILSPAEGEPIASGTTVWLEGQAYDREAEQPELDELVWTSSLQGELGRGPRLAVDLVSGRHTITLRAGHGERQGDASVSLVVGRSRG
jgi:hypothetical protein